MEIRRLSYFIRIAEDGSLTKAAGMVRVAQSALSRQMRLLEEELGVALFDRTARGMRLTVEGEHLRASVAGPLRELELAIQGIRTGRSGAQANLALGLPPSLADLLARPLAMELHAAFPDIRFRLVEGPTGGLIDWLGRGMIDFAILEETSRNDLLVEQKLLSLPFTLIGAVEGDGPAGATVQAVEALRLPLIVPSHHLGVRAAINDAASHWQARLDVRFEADSARLIKDLVQSGMGYALLPDSYVGQEVRQGSLRGWPVADPALTLDIFFASRKASQSAGRQFASVVDFIARAVEDKLRC
ncbi:LysR family transcriptional regulator [Sphingobium sufflavum]|uniref:LysR family transcriptional regulator n=1 Tax=Sphingobium sufflavum TaxID=1129547 RepID=UPI001F293D34|nr:LysR family transcriptional regulator [Sphingobium sufflavum]MCE7796632.1 LysR family transcriptional regulator [Sphingobium sufflavum]